MFPISKFRPMRLTMFAGAQSVVRHQIQFRWWLSRRWMAEKSANWAKRLTPSVETRHRWRATASSWLRRGSFGVFFVLLGTARSWTVRRRKSYWLPKRPPTGPYQAW